MQSCDGTNLNAFLHKNCPSPILISFKGSNTSTAYNRAVVDYFSQKCLLWKSSFETPLSLKFAVNFASFSEECLFNVNDSISSARFAYVHVFYINSESVDEYRTSIRHNVSEWFATVNAAQVQWLIVVDSTRAKDKKNRTALMEKINSDFNKFLQRIVEVSESVEHGSFGLFTDAIEKMILAHLEVMNAIFTARIAQLNDSANNGEWDLMRYYNTMVEYGDFFWRLGAFEFALSTFDDCDRTMLTLCTQSKIIHGNSFLSLHNVEILTLPGIMNSLSSSLSLATIFDLRSHLLAKQLFLTLRIFDLQPKEANSGSVVATFVLHYVQHCINSVLTNSNYLKCNHEHEVACWTLCMVSNGLELCDWVCSPFAVEGANNVLCNLLLLRFDAFMEIALLPRSDSATQRLLSCLSNSRSSIYGFLSECIKSCAWADELRNCHDSTSAFLLQCGRKRQAAIIGYKYATVLRKLDESQKSLPYQLAIANSLMTSDHKWKQLRCILEDVICSLDEKSDRNRHCAYLLHLMLDNSQDCSAFHLKSLQEKARVGEMLLLNDVGSRLPVLFNAYITCDKSSVSLHDSFSLLVRLETVFPIVANDCELCLTLSSSLEPSSDPSFEMWYSTREHTCRVLLNTTTRTSSFVTSSSNLTSQSFSLQAITNLTMSGVAKKAGPIFVRSAQLYIDNRSFAFDVNVFKLDSLLLFVSNPIHELRMSLGQNSDLFYGVAQRFQLLFRAAHNLESSEIDVSGATCVVHILDAMNSWQRSDKIRVPPLSSGIEVAIDVYIYVELQAISSPTLCKEKINFTWLNHTREFEIPFLPLFTTVTRISQLEHRNLLEIDVSRTVADVGLMTILNPMLTTANGENGELLSCNQLSVVPNSTITLVFLLPEHSSSVANVCLKYITDSAKDRNGEFPSELLKQEYTMKTDVQLPKSKIEYEICTQLLSQLPGAQLCRVDTPCELVVSLRCLGSCLDSICVTLGADPLLWNLECSSKVFQPKGCGLGQVTFHGVVPLMSGLLPYPSVSLHTCFTTSRLHDEEWTEGADILAGDVIPSFQRTAGRQIRVLTANSSTVDSVSLNKRQSGLKQKLVQLFE